ncbi:hypothetical protein [Helicobacter sp. 11S02629-2]|uniref:hypothetical protein n=1 Tax=Helicobacter sp. 11S02629-2 TaxID=1476195 RepID=UPI000BA61EC2|nr:hypothetical protein [Helicobacter sp. 11S02629-2]PAF45893.1 hypothetical protein BKH40_00325 [Helicobacter sp. 11S02629-2]
MILGVLASLGFKQFETFYAYRQAHTTITDMQVSLNRLYVDSYMKHQEVSIKEALEVLKPFEGDFRFYTLRVSAREVTLRIGGDTLRLRLRQDLLNRAILTCNPTEYLCRKVYNRTFDK